MIPVEIAGITERFDLGERVGQRILPLQPEHLVEAAREGDAFALGEMARFNDYLARVLVNVAFTLAPEVVVKSGEVSP